LTAEEMQEFHQLQTLAGQMAAPFDRTLLHGAARDAAALVE
jgi:hypothetical protein